MGKDIIPVAYPISVGDKVANIDANYGPYESLAAAYSALNNRRIITEGYTVGIIQNDGLIVEYWFQGGTDLGHLVRKHKAIVNLADYEEGDTLPDTMVNCSFHYEGTTVYTVPYTTSDSEDHNCTLVFANFLENAENRELLYVIEGDTITSVYEDSAIPDWAMKYSPDNGVVSLQAGTDPGTIIVNGDTENPVTLNLPSPGVEDIRVINSNQLVKDLNGTTSTVATLVQSYNDLSDTPDKAAIEALLEAPNGVAALDAEGHISTDYIPEVVDNVVPFTGCYEYHTSGSTARLFRPVINGKLKPNPTIADFTAGTEIVPSSDPSERKICYIALDYGISSSCGIYYWEGSAFGDRQAGDVNRVYIESSRKAYVFQKANLYQALPLCSDPGTTDDIPEGNTNKYVSSAQKTRIDSSVLFTNQSLTAEQKEDARRNIGAGTYSKPSGGIPATDMDDSVQESLENANAAYSVVDGKLETSWPLYPNDECFPSSKLVKDTFNSIAPKAVIGTSSGQSYSPDEYASTKAVKDYADSHMPIGGYSVVSLDTLDNFVEADYPGGYYPIYIEGLWNTLEGIWNAGSIPVVTMLLPNHTTSCAMPLVKDPTINAYIGVTSKISAMWTGWIIIEDSSSTSRLYIRGIYQKPSSGIPKSDLATEVKDYLITTEERSKIAATDYCVSAGRYQTFSALEQSRARTNINAMRVPTNAYTNSVGIFIQIKDHKDYPAFHPDLNYVHEKLPYRYRNIDIYEGLQDVSYDGTNYYLALPKNINAVLEAKCISDGYLKCLDLEWDNDHQYWRITNAGDNFRGNTAIVQYARNIDPYYDPYDDPYYSGSGLFLGDLQS